MNLECEKISSTQFLFSVTCFLQASTLLTGILVDIVNQDSWMAALAGILFCLPFIWVWVKLTKWFPGKNLIEINTIVLGPIIGKVFSILYLFFFINLGALNLRDLTGFANGSIMPSTPPYVLSITFMLLCAYATYYGIEVVMRFSVGFVLFTFAIIVLTALALINQMDIRNLLPMFTYPIGDYVHAINVASVIPFGELVIFMMFIPSVREQTKVKRSFFLGFLLGGLNALITIIRDTALLGNLMPIFSVPSFETLRMVSLTESISRIEVFYAIFLIILLFFKISIIYYAIVLVIAQLTGMRTYRPLILVTGVIIICYALTMFRSSVEHALYGQNVISILWLLFEFIMPLVTLIVAAVLKKHPRPEACSI